LNVSLSLSPRVDDPAYRAATFDEVAEAYAHQMWALRDGGVDLLLIETVFDTLNAKAAIVAARDVAPELPLWLSFTAVDKSGRNGRINIVGGCCGTTPEHVRQIAAAVEGVAPRGVPERRPGTRFSGLEPLELRPDSNFTMIGERTNITGSARFRRLVEGGDFQ